jgi:hypothetical protein
MTAGAGGGASTGGGFVVQAESASANRARRVSNRKSRSHALIKPLLKYRFALRCQYVFAKRVFAKHLARMVTSFRAEDQTQRGFAGALASSDARGIGRLVERDA